MADINAGSLGFRVLLMVVPLSSEVVIRPILATEEVCERGWLGGRTKGSFVSLLTLLGVSMVLGFKTSGSTS